MKLKPGKRAQLTFEFLAATVVMLVIFLSLLTLYFEKSNSYRDFATRNSATRIAFEVARTINHVLQAGNSTNATMWVKPELETGENYSIKIVGRRIELIFRTGSVSASVLTNNISNSSALSPGRNLAVKNVDGGVVLG